MAIEISNNGATERVASAGQGNLATALGAIGAGLGVLNSGGILNGGFLGGNNGGVVDMKTYYTDRIADIQLHNSDVNNLQMQLCNLQERVAVNQNSNEYQNRIDDIRFGNVQNQFDIFDRLVRYEIAAAVCRKVDGDLFLSPAKLGNGYIAPTQVLESHEARPYREGFGHGCSPCYGGF